MTEPEPVEHLLQTFFTAYARATDDGDFERIAASYVPTYVESSPAACVAWTVDDVYRVGLRDQTAAMRDLGLIRSEATVEQVTDLAPGHVSVRVGWALTFERSPTPITSRFEITYVVRLIDGPRIAMYVSHEDEATVLRRDGIVLSDEG